MRLKEAAFIIGSLGGRPPINVGHVQGKKVWSYRGGFGVTHGSALLLEDGVSFLLLEDGVSLLLLE